MACRRGLTEIKRALDVTDAMHLLDPGRYRTARVRCANAIIAHRRNGVNPAAGCAADRRRQGSQGGDGIQSATRGGQTRSDRAEQAVERARVLVAGGAEVGAASSAPTRCASADTALDRLFRNSARATAPDGKRRYARQEADSRCAEGGRPCRRRAGPSGLQGRAEGHVAVQKGSELRNLRRPHRIGWPRDAMDAALVALCNVGQVRTVAEDRRQAGSPGD